MNSFQALAQLISSQIVNCLVLGLAIAALATTASALVARRNSGTRFAVWFAAMLAIASLFLFAKPLAHSAVAVHVGAPEISLPAQWALYIFLAWAFFAGIGLARIARGLWRVRSLKKSCVPLEGSLPDRIVNPATSRGIAICTSESLRVPAALGFFHPVIALPGWTLRELSGEELNAVVLHEAAHLERWDDWTNLAQNAHRSLALVQAAIGHVKHTAQRISKILDGRQRRVAPAFKPALAALLAFGAISMVAMQHAPQLVSFRSTERSTASADKFDYVAMVNPPKGNAVAASLHVPSPAPAKRTAAKTEVRQTGHRPSALVQRNVTHAPHTLTPLPTEEARKPIEKRNPAIVNAAMTDDATPSFVYLVTQSEQFDSFGNLTVTTSVWRIRVLRPAPAQATQSGVIPHST